MVPNWIHLYTLITWLFSLKKVCKIVSKRCSPFCSSWMLCVNSKKDTQNNNLSKKRKPKKKRNKTKQNNNNNIKKQAQARTPFIYPGSRGPFSKYLVWNKPCLRFDNWLPRRTSGHSSKQPHFHARNQFRIWTGSPIGYSHVRRELKL